MSEKSVLKTWVTNALAANDGCGSPLSVSVWVWEHHAAELEAMGSLFYTWQYDLRWAATSLRHDGVLQSNKSGEPWRLIESD